MALNATELKTKIDEYLNDLDGFVEDDKGTLEGYEGLTLEQVRMVMNDFLTGVEMTE